MKAFAFGSALLFLISSAFYAFGKDSDDWQFFMAISAVFALLTIAAAIVPEA